jgi:hypothetical protein
MTYKITRTQLQASTSDCIKDLASTEFVTSVDNSYMIKYPILAIRREMNACIWEDHTRTLRFNGRLYEDQTPEEKERLSHLLDLQKHNRDFISNYYTDPNYAAFDWVDWANTHRTQGLADILNHEFPGDIDGVNYSDLILEHQSQAPLGPVSIPVQEWAIRTGSFAKEISASRRDNLYSSVENEQQKMYYAVTMEKFVITCFKTGRQVTIRGGHLEYQLTPEGYAYDENKSFAFGLDYHRIMTSTMPHRLDALLAYPLQYRLQDAYAAVFHANANDDNNNNKMTARKWLGWPIKFVAEFLPSAMAKTARWARDQILENFPDAYSIPQPLLRLPTQLVAGLAMVILSLIEITGKAANTVLSRVTSPLKSYEQAKAIHPLLGAASALFSIAATLALGLTLSPLLPALGLGTAAAWVVAHTGVIGSFFAVMGAKIASIVGLSVAPAVAAVSLMTAGLYSMVVTPVRYMANRINRAQGQGQIHDQVAPERVAEEIKPGLSDNLIQERLKANLVQNPNPTAVVNQYQDNPLVMPTEEKQEVIHPINQTPNINANPEPVSYGLR